MADTNSTTSTNSPNSQNKPVPDALKNLHDKLANSVAPKEEDKKVIAAASQVISQTAQSIEATLAERGANYGKFSEHARITQNIKNAMKDSPNWETLPPNMKECLEMIAHKTGRILNGDPNFHDSWHDIVGYTKLVADNLKGVDN